MAARQLPDPQTLRKLLRYDPDTGKLYWLPRSAEMFCHTGRGGREANAKRWNRRWAGKEAFTAVHHDGYLVGAIFYVRLAAHQVAWAIAKGEWPAHEIDHASGKRSDNRLLNLRAATPVQNGMNRSRASNNSSGHKGVNWCAIKKRWRVRICANRKRIALGYFRDFDAARRAYEEASARLHGEFRRAT